MKSSTNNHRPKFALGTFSFAGCPPFAGLVLEAERVIAVEALRGVAGVAGHSLPPAHSTLALFENWQTALPALQAAAEALVNGVSPEARAAAESMVPLRSLQVHPPVAARQILMSGANYFKHVVDIIVDLGPGKNPGTEGMNPTQLRTYAEDLMRKRQKEGSPYVFTKPVSVMSGAFDPIVIPSFAEQPDWELELAIVLAAPARNVKREDAMRYVAGYTIANDITNRDWVYARAEMKALGTDWLTAKSCPTYLPIGPYIVPATQVADPKDLRIELKLNGETKQDDSTSDMIFDIPRLIEHISSVVQLLPGDVICTGSPAGNGTHYNRYLQPGDVVEGAITGLGSQRTIVVSERS
jgi:2,4-didehydro-3-deoxy-L-rhamnonate hydrolase